MQQVRYSVIIRAQLGRNDQSIEVDIDELVDVEQWSMLTDRRNDKTGNNMYLTGAVKRCCC